MNRQSLLFIASLSFFLVFLLIVWPSDGINIAGLKLSFINLKNVLEEKDGGFNKVLIEYNDTKQSDSKDNIKLIEHKDPAPELLKKTIDSLKKTMGLKITESDFKESLYLINPVRNNTSPLDVFFYSLNELKSLSDSMFRVGHYGDSQIEGGRLTNTLRELFQSYFGGGGIGFVPIDDVTSPVTFTTNLSNNWTRYAATRGRPRKGGLGPAGLAFKYNSNQNNSELSEAEYTATVTFNSLKPFSNFTIWYGYGKEDSKLTVLSKNKVISDLELNNNASFNVVSIPLSNPSTNVTLRFKGPSPFIYGATLDNAKGVQLDNYGIRGHSGEGFLSISKDELTGMYKKINNKLAILQFGGNVTPYLKDEKSLLKMKNIYQSIYLRFKQSSPNGSILIISVNDVSRHVKGGVESYPNISSLRYIQRELAINNGCAFFDLYQFMGGDSSIKVWSELKLAAKDGHLSPVGRDLVAKEIFKALMFEFKQYKIRNVDKK